MAHVRLRKFDTSAYYRDHDISHEVWTVVRAGNQIFLRGQTGFDLDDYCYYFARPYENPPRLNQLYDAIDRAVDQWQAERRQREPVLRLAEDAAGRATVYDSRRLPATTIALSNQERAILDICNRPRAIARIADALAISGDDPPVAAAVDRLDQLGLIFRDSERIVSLVLPPEGVYPQRRTTLDVRVPSANSL